MLYPQVNSRRSLLPLSGFWQFSLDANERGEEKRWFEGLPSSRPIGVPGSWNEQYDDTMFYNGSAWYETSFYVPAEWRGRLVRLRFGAAGYRSSVWFDGVPLGEHEGNSLPFGFDVTKRVKPGGKHRLVVKINNQLGPQSIPPGGTEHAGKEGGQSDFMTEAISNFASVLPEIQMLPLLLEMRRQYPDVPFDFLPYAGIHRPVVLYATPKDRLEKIRVEMEIKRGKALVRCAVQAEGHASAVRAYLSRGEKAFEAEADLQDGKAALEFSILRPSLWHPNSPHLYQLTVSLLKNSKVIDEYHTEVGIRSIEVTEDRILLNGEPIYLNGVCKHEDFPILGKGLSEPVIVKDFSLMKWLGANSFRTSHYPYAEEQLMLADRMGFLVIDEMPAVGLNYNMYNDTILEKCKGILTELIERDSGHPSVIMWSIANEPDPFTESACDFFGKLREHAKQLDPSRPVTIASVHSPTDYTFDVVDVISINRYYGWYTEPGRLDVAAEKLSRELDRIFQKHRKPIIVSEFGADSIAGLHADPPEIFTEEYQAALLRAYIEVIRSKSFTVGEHVWNFADFKTPQNYSRTVFNRKGLFTRDRRPKLAAHMIRQLWKAGAGPPQQQM
jgi:beta-glucuronidase